MNESSCLDSALSVTNLCLVGPTLLCWFCLTSRFNSKSDLSITTKCDQNHISDICEFGLNVGVKHEL
jgi:hypothetical protein